MREEFAPTPDDRFTFGLWTVGNPGRDPFGHETRPPLDPDESVERLAALGAYGVNFHDDDLVPPGSSASEREAIVKQFRRTLDADRHARAHGHDEPVLERGVQGRRVHRERSRGSPLRARQDAGRDRPRCGARRHGLRDVGRTRRLRERRGEGRATRARPLQGGGRPLLRVRRAIGATTCDSRSNRSRTSRAATSCCPPSVTRSRSSTGSSGRRWSG